MPRFTAPVVSSADILPDSVTTAALADGAVTTIKIASLAVTDAKIANLAVTAAKIANLAVTDAKIANLAVTAAKIANLAVTDAKIANATITAAKILSLNADAITAGIITGLRYRTDVSGERLEIRGDTGEGFIRMYNSAGTQVGIMGYEPSGFGTNTLGIANSSGLGGITMAANGTLILAAGGSAGLGIEVQSSAAGGLPGTIFSVATSGGTLRILTVDTNNQLMMLPGGSQARPDYAFIGDGDTGMMRFGVNNGMLVAGGAAAIQWLSNNVYLWGARSNTTASAANTLIQSADGRIFRSTSSARYKTAIKPWDRRHSVLDAAPVLYRSTSNGDDSRRVRLGLLAENVDEVFPLAAIRDVDGRPDAIDWNTITAGLLFELADLERRVAALEAA